MQLTVRVPDPLASQLKATAESQDRPLNWVVVKALEKYLGEPKVESQVPQISKTPNAEARVESQPPGVTKASELVKGKLYRCKKCDYESPSSTARCPEHNTFLYPVKW